MLALFAYGTNTGIRHVGAGDHGHSEDDLRYVRRRFVTAGVVRSFAIEIANATFAARDPQVWGQTSTTVGSDSKHIGALDHQVLSEGQERGSLIVTTNLPFGEWTKVFPDARLAKAVVDRLTHRAHIIDTGNESWRFRHGLNRNKEN